MVPLTTAPSAGEVSVVTGGTKSLSTNARSGPESTQCPAASQACAENECAPLPTVPESQAAEYGAAADVPTSAPSTKNATLTMASSPSIALAASVANLGSVMRYAGYATTTWGELGSGSTTLTETGADTV